MSLSDLMLLPYFYFIWLFWLLFNPYKGIFTDGFFTKTLALIMIMVQKTTFLLNEWFVDADDFLSCTLFCDVSHFLIYLISLSLSHLREIHNVSHYGWRADNFFKCDAVLLRIFLLGCEAYQFSSTDCYRMWYECAALNQLTVSLFAACLPTSVIKIK